MQIERRQLQYTYQYIEYALRFVVTITMYLKSSQFNLSVPNTCVHTLISLLQTHTLCAQCSVLCLCSITSDTRFRYHNGLRTFIVRIYEGNVSVEVKASYRQRLSLVRKRFHGLAYPILAHLREFAEKRVWVQRRCLVVTRCHHSILCRRSREALAANQRHCKDYTLNICFA